MKHTEKQITEIALNVLKDIDGKYYRENCIEKIWFEEHEKLIEGVNKDQQHPCWTIAVSSLFDNTDFLIISDETGEPLYYQNFNYIITEIIKKEDGIYDYKQ